METEADRQKRESKVRYMEMMTEAERTAFMTIIIVGGGMIFNTNNISPDYYKSWGGQFYAAGEFYRRHTRYLRCGIFMEFGGLGKINRDLIREHQQTLHPDSGIVTASFRVAPFMRWYPFSDILYFMGSVGFGHYGTTAHKITPKNPSSDPKKVDIVNVNTPIFPIGGGLSLGESGIFAEGLCTIVPFKGRITNHIAVNFGIRMDKNIVSKSGQK